jgi:hypothetical protein
VLTSGSPPGTFTQSSSQRGKRPGRGKSAASAEAGVGRPPKRMSVNAPATMSGMSHSNLFATTAPVIPSWSSFGGEAHQGYLSSRLGGFVIRSLVVAAARAVTAKAYTLHSYLPSATWPPLREALGFASPPRGGFAFFSQQSNYTMLQLASQLRYLSDAHPPRRLKERNLPE